MNTFQLDCFLAVAEYLNFAKAAEQMGISQPAITHQIQGLETELNTKLFRRTTRIVELTSQGLSFLDDAKSIIFIAKQAQKRFESPDEQEIIELSIGCTSQSQIELLPDAICSLIQIYPNLHPSIKTIPNIQILDKVEIGTLDIAFSPLNTNLKKNTLVYRELKKAPVVCVCSDTSSLAGKTSISAEELENEKLVLHHPGSVSPEIAKIQKMLAAPKKSSDLYFCDSPEAAMLLAKAGLGIAILPDVFIPHNHGLQIVALENTDSISIGLYYKAHQRISHLRDFIKIISEQYKKAEENN